MKYRYCSIYNILNGHIKVPAIFQKPFWQLFKYFCNIATFQRNIFEIFPQYYGAMWVTSCWKRGKLSQLRAINNNWWNWYKHRKKTATVRQMAWQTNFSPWKCSSTYSRTRKKWMTGHELGRLISRAIFTGYSTIW